MEYKVKDITIYYEIYGSGTPILMIHGWGPDHRLMKGCMEPIFQSINNPWKRIYFDLPGMGKTKGKPWIIGSDQMLDLILDFIDGIIPDQNFLIVGQSYGGYLARGVVKKRKSNINGLLLICPVAAPETQQENAPILKVLEKDESFMNSLSEEDKEYFKTFAVLLNKRAWLRYQEEILKGLKIADNSFLENCLGQNVPFNFKVDNLETPFMKPTLMIMGRQDSAVGYCDLWQIIELYPRASFVILDKAGHSLQIEQDILFNELVKEWLNRVLEETD
ncbi:MAG: alpha/beta hydrolase [Candidatus Lokiarchaeota archaeon]|nr:alpha/beta hydrolase [Candidatus Lokiarchaeota archaeon]